MTLKSLRNTAANLIVAVTVPVLVAACSIPATHVSTVRQPVPKAPAPPPVTAKAPPAKPPVPVEPPPPAAKPPAAEAPAPLPEEAAAVVPEGKPKEEIFRPVTMEELADLSLAGEAARDETVPVPELVGSEEVREAEEQATAAGEEAEAAEAPPKPAVQYDMPLENHKRVYDYIERFQTSRRQSFLRGLRRSKIYEKTAKDIFREEGVPTDLYYLALIESAFNPKAYSRARAMGIWQFIYTTGKSYGLRRNHWIDERRDPEKASRAAARHLKDLYEDLGSWPLALASYNAGINRVKRAIKKAGTRNFWALRLPAQTRNYVPAFYAALMIAKDPESYGFSVGYDNELEVEKVAVDGGTRLSLVATFCGVTLQEIRDLNPELRQGCAPPGGAYDLKVPPGKTTQVAEGLARTPKPKITGWGTYRIRTGDTLSTIASRFGTSVPAIQEVNNLASHFIRAGDTLVIPGSGVVGSIPELPDEGFVVPPSGVHHVRRGDSLWSISRRYRIPLERLMDFNALNPRSILQIGQVVRLRDETRSEVASAEQKPAGGGTFFYRVRRGDNLWKISRKFGTDMDTILRANRMSKGQTLYPGDRLIIPGG